MAYPVATMSLVVEISELLGLSTVTVESALHGLPGIDRETVEAVRNLAEVLGGMELPRAQLRSHAIGVVLPSVKRWFYTEVLSGVTSALVDVGVDTVLFDLVQYGHPGRRDITGALSRHQVDALIVLATEFTETEWRMFSDMGIPVVAIGPSTPGIRRIGVDDYQIGRTITERVVALGHRDIGYLGGFDTQALTFVSTNDRERVFRDVLAEHDIPIRSEWMISGEYRLGLAKRATERFLKQSMLPTVIICASDEMAIGAMYAITAAGLRVGRDISLVGIDNHEYAEAFGLSTIAQYPEEQGALAARTLFAELAGARPVSLFPPARWEYIERSSLVSR